MTEFATAEVKGEFTGQKQEVLLAFHRVCWEEMTWRRNAGYRTVILGMAYCGLLLTLLAARTIHLNVRICLAAVVALATLFGAGYLASNYRKYMEAARRMVRIEEYVGAFKGDYLGPLGALMDEARRTRPNVPLSKDPVCLWSVVAFAAGGLLTAGAILLI
jgi:hypothetical protein